MLTEWDLNTYFDCFRHRRQTHFILGHIKITNVLKGLVVADKTTCYKLLKYYSFPFIERVLLKIN